MAYKDIKTSGPTPLSPASLVDPMGRQITYLRLSVTDRCDFRCQYCMAEKVQFLPKKEVLSLEELYQTARVFMSCGINKIRLTGGEPLVRRDIQTLVHLLGKHVASGDLKELTVTTNGSQLEKEAAHLYANHVRRINISLDSLDAEKFARITRRGDLPTVLRGIEAAKTAGLQVKINMVVMGKENIDDIASMLDYSIKEGFDLTLIEAMPMEAGGIDRQANYVALNTVINRFKSQYGLVESDHKTGGPARYLQVSGQKTRLGLITPLSQNFCSGCNRIRLTCTGKLYPCLGHDTHLDFRDQLRKGASEADLIDALRSIIARKPKAHDFTITEEGTTSATMRSMNTTGG